MQDLDQLPLEQWAAQLKQAREAGKLDFSQMAQELRLSAAQLRAIENGSLASFHGPGYYLRAVEKYAQQLGITLDPPVTELELTDSQLALKRVKNTPTASTLAKKQENLLGASAMPRAMRRSRIGLWLGAILLALVAIGTWMAFIEGWPNGNETTLARTETVDAGVANDSNPPSVPAAEVSVVSNSMNDMSAPTPAPDLGSVTETEPETTVAASGTVTTPPSAASLETPAPTQSVTDSVSVGIPVTASLPAPETTPETAAEEPPPPPPPDVIEVSFTDDCWVEVRRIDGTTEQAIYKPGQTLTVPVDDLDRLSFGNAQAANAMRGGDPFDVIAFTRGGNNVARIPGDDLR